MKYYQCFIQIILTILLVFSSTSEATAYQADFSNFDSSDSRWNITDGSWTNHANGVQNDGGSYRNRLFINNLVLGTGTYTVSTTATLYDGWGWAVFFDGQLNNNNDYTGLTLQYDPGYGSGAIVLRNWVNNSESSLDYYWFNNLSEPLDVYGTAHTLLIQRTETDVTTYLDGYELFTKTVSVPAGGLLGLRSWASSEVVYHSLDAGGDISGSAVPEPTTVALLGLGSLALIRRKNNFSSQGV